jgi:hypothetical protein
LLRQVLTWSVGGGGAAAAGAAATAGGGGGAAAGGCVAIIAPSMMSVNCVHGMYTFSSQHAVPSKDECVQ